ncbi:MAG: S-layer homology domain-containing protein [Caldilineaceae bacterium]|nr:S-layer homology domain-containing protein [Caldilineaceae bacterium]MDE0502243.1 S-layer homology domain-containing protein [bacterium]
MNPRTAIITALAVLCVAFAGVAIAQTTPKGSAQFTDVPEGHWADEAIGWAVENGITSGISDTEFGPDDTLTRARMVTFLHRYHQNVIGGGTPATTTTTAATTTTTTTTEPESCADVLCSTDHYSYVRFSNTYWVFEFVTGRSCSSLYVEVQLLDANERRIGDWGNEFLSNVAAGYKVVVEIRSDAAWQYYEWEYTCR